MILRNRLGQVCVIVLVITHFNGCKDEPPAPPPEIRPVKYQKVVATGGARVRTFSGVARAGFESNLSFKVGGNIKAIHVRVGDRVKSGQIIAELDKVDYEIRVEEAKAALSQAMAQARNARADYDRVRALYEENNASKDQLDAARAAAESTEAQVDSASKRLELTRLQVSYTRLTAPVAGAIADVPVEVNENVPSGKPIVMLNSGPATEVEVGIPENLIAQVKRGDAVSVIFGAVPGKEFQATVTEIGVASRQSASTFPVILRLARTDSSVRPGMAAEAAFRFDSADHTERFRVPPEAVGEDRQGRFLFVIEARENGLGVARRRTVKVGQLSSDGLEILEGLSDGDLIATAGINKIEDGREVKLVALN